LLSVTAVRHTPLIATESPALSSAASGVAIVIRAPSAERSMSCTEPIPCTSPVNMANPPSSALKTDDRGLVQPGEFAF
jgi:hypothetical protein